MPMSAKQRQNPGGRPRRYTRAENKGLVTQAQRVYRVFGGVKNLHRCLLQAGVKRDITWIYRWDYPKIANGAGGVVPAQAWPDIKKAASIEGIVLPESIYDPTPREVDSKGRLK